MKTKRTLLVGIAALVLMSVSLPDDLSAQGRHGPPPWAPAHGYRAKMAQRYAREHNYYYYPRYNCYYDTDRRVYIYMNGGSWAISAGIPMRYREFDLDNSPHVSLRMESETPQIYNREHRRHYASAYAGDLYFEKQNHGHGRRDR